MEELLTYIEEYRRQHPEIDSFLKRFEIVRGSYERYLALTTMPLPQTRPTNTTQVGYDADVSAVSGHY